MPRRGWECLEGECLEGECIEGAVVLPSKMYPGGT